MTNNDLFSDLSNFTDVEPLGTHKSLKPQQIFSYVLWHKSKWNIWWRLGSVRELLIEWRQKVNVSLQSIERKGRGLSLAYVTRVSIQDDDQVSWNDVKYCIYN